MGQAAQSQCEGSTAEMLREATVISAQSSGAADGTGP
jgi:hypothetical protein